jgi:hypothetical protein
MSKFKLRQSAVEKLSKYVTKPDLYNNNFVAWEKAVLNDKIKDDHGFNYFVRNWTVLGDEQSRYEDEIGKDINYFKTTYNVNDEAANLMKQLVDTLTPNTDIYESFYTQKLTNITSKKNKMNQLTQLRQLIKESIQEYIREVETSGNVAAQEAKIRACDEAITLREKKINLEGLDEAYQDMIDEAKKKNLEKEIKELQKYKKKAEKILEKMKSKSAPKKMEDESVEEEAVIDEVSLDEMSPELEEEDATLDEAKKKKAAKKDKEEKEEKEVVNESFNRMQKLAGIIK